MGMHDLLAELTLPLKPLVEPGGWTSPPDEPPTAEDPSVEPEYRPPDWAKSGFTRLSEPMTCGDISLAVGWSPSELPPRPASEPWHAPPPPPPEVDSAAEGVLRVHLIGVSGLPPVSFHIEPSGRVKRSPQVRFRLGSVTEASRVAEGVPVDQMAEYNEDLLFQGRLSDLLSRGLSLQLWDKHGVEDQVEAAMNPPRA